MRTRLYADFDVQAQSPGRKALILKLITRVAEEFSQVYRDGFCGGAVAVEDETGTTSVPSNGAAAVASISSLRCNLVIEYTRNVNFGESRSNIESWRNQAERRFRSVTRWTFADVHGFRLTYTHVIIVSIVHV